MNNENEVAVLLVKPEKKYKRLLIAAIVLLVIATVFVVFSAALGFSIESIQNEESNDLGDGFGIFFMLIFLLPMEIAGVALSLIAVGLLIAPLKSDVKKKKIASLVFLIIGIAYVLFLVFIFLFCIIL